ncbi:uncharacterized protein fs(1)N isoform X2 [Fopius arisanus]|uniref:Uncharacterized protein fs(1)N isoform X2 n=1 Tax=Fopius arisanus TaxID=64838 RepID=A0A9R1TKN5_9HYME|nr:PREDICTED: uncharacterized protein LOC105271073 isoform X2 [Fopius arisanus]
MAGIEHLFITVTLVYLMCGIGQCLDIQSMSNRLDEMLTGISEPSSRESEWTDEIQRVYDFGNGDGHREELLVTNITNSVHKDLFIEANNYKFFTKNGIFYLATSTPLMFALNIVDKTFNEMRPHWIIPPGRIRTFEVLTSPNATAPHESQIIVVLSVEEPYGNQLLWYILSDDHFQEFWSWPIQDRVGRLLHFRYKNQDRLITMTQSPSSRSNYSHIYVWGFRINGNLSNFWLSQRLPGSDALDVRECPAYNGVMIALQMEDKVSLYGYTKENSKESYFQSLPSVKSIGLKNFACFQSGHILYLGMSGPNAAILDFFEGEFGFHQALSEVLSEEITWMEAIPVDTYRDEVLVLVQMKNQTIAGLVWQDNTFRSAPLPPFDTTDLRLSEITVIPKIGFIYKNRIVRIQTEFKQLVPPVYEEVEKLFQRREALSEIMRKQNLIINCTKSRIKSSYLTTSTITGHWEINHLKSRRTIIGEGVKPEKISLGGKILTQRDFEVNLIEALSTLQELQRKLDVIHGNMKKAIPKNSTRFDFPGSLHILGDLTVNDLSVENPVFERVNNHSIASLFTDLFAYDSNVLIKGQKTFPSINVTALTVNSINGIPLEDIVFDKNLLQYHDVDLYNLKKLVVNGNMNFSFINNYNWLSLIDNVVLKSESVRIPNNTTVKGILTAKYVDMNRLNGLKYREDYVSRTSTDAVNVPSKKTFKTLTTRSLNNLLTINGIPVEEFILLHNNQNLDMITFESLAIIGILQIDGNITGGPVIPELSGLSNETRSIMSPVTFRRLKVERKVQVNQALNNKTWETFNDLVNNNEAVVEIRGKKIFKGPVVIKPKINITRGIINGHLLREFMTLDTAQELPNLKKIEANVTFGKLIRGDFARLDAIFSECLEKVLTFKVPPVVEQLVFDTLNGNVSREDFMARLNETSMICDRVIVQELHTPRLSTMNVNGVSLEDFTSRLISKTKSQELSGNFDIGNLNTGTLRATALDGKSVVDLESERRILDDLYNSIVNGSVSINDLEVTEIITTPRVNGYELVGIYHAEDMGKVVFHNNVTITELWVEGLFNGWNFSEVVDDAVLKTDRSISVRGLKKAQSIICEMLDVASWNNHPVTNFLNPDVHQVLTGPVVVKGTTTVLKSFDGNKKIGNVTLNEIKKRIHSVADRKFLLNGNFRFPGTVDIRNLLINGSIQGVDFNALEESLVFLNNENISISGPLLLKNSVKLGNLTITHRLNDNNLQDFYKNVVLLGGPINGRLITSGDVMVRGDLLVTGRIDVKNMMDIDVNQLRENAVYLNQPAFTPGETVFKDVVFNSIKAERINDLLMTDLFPHHKDRVIPSLHCINISADVIRIEGTLNNETLKKMYDESFQLSGPQNITGYFSFLENVNIRRDLDVVSINGINPLNFETLDDNGSISDLIFQEDVVLNGSLRVLGLYNGIDPLTWQATAITTTFPMTQTVSGVWTIDGNVHLKGPVRGSATLNGINIANLVKHLRERDLQVFKFPSRIISVHSGSDPSDYLFVSLEDGALVGFVFDGEEFTGGPVIEGFGVVEEWISLEYQELRYFVTMGIKTEGKSQGNLWRLTDKEMVHVKELGNLEGGKKVNDQEFLVIVKDQLIHYSLQDIQGITLNPKRTFSLGRRGMRFVRGAESNEVILLGEDAAVLLDLASGEVNTRENPFGTDNVFRFRVGPFQRERFVYYDEAAAQDFIFIADYEESGLKILQSIEARPSGIRSMRFQGGEEFLLWIEGCRINVYEYKGIEGFVFVEALHVGAEKLVEFRIKRHPLFAGVNCLGAVQGNILTILEAKMDGLRIEGNIPECDY